MMPYCHWITGREGFNKELKIKFETEGETEIIIHSVNKALGLNEKHYRVKIQNFDYGLFQRLDD